MQVLCFCGAPGCGGRGQHRNAWACMQRSSLLGIESQRHICLLADRVDPLSAPWLVSRGHAAACYCLGRTADTHLPSGFCGAAANRHSDIDAGRPSSKGSPPRFPRAARFPLGTTCVSASTGRLVSPPSPPALAPQPCLLAAVGKGRSLRGWRVLSWARPAAGLPASGLRICLLLLMIVHQSTRCRVWPLARAPLPCCAAHRCACCRLCRHQHPFRSSGRCAPGRHGV